MKNIVIVVLFIALAIAVYCCYNLSHKPNTCTQTVYVISTSTVDSLLKLNGTIVLGLPQNSWVYPLHDVNDSLYKAGESLRAYNPASPGKFRNSWFDEYMGAQAQPSPTGPTTIASTPWRCPPFCAIEITTQH